MLSLVLAASFWLVLGVLLASFRVLLVAPRCLLGLSWRPLDALEVFFATDSASICEKTIFKQHSHIERRFFEHSVSLTGLLLFLIPDG